VKKEQLQKKIGQRIIQLREEKGWSQADLARACNKDRQAIEIIENGKVNPTPCICYPTGTKIHFELVL
jgi:transcriptional regulator with XRE-family HTH domain